MSTRQRSLIGYDTFSELCGSSQGPAGQSLVNSQTALHLLQREGRGAGVNGLGLDLEHGGQRTRAVREENDGLVGKTQPVARNQVGEIHVDRGSVGVPYLLR